MFKRFVGTVPKYFCLIFRKTKSTLIHCEISDYSDFFLNSLAFMVSNVAVIMLHNTYSLCKIKYRRLIQILIRDQLFQSFARELYFDYFTNLLPHHIFDTYNLR